MRFLDHTEQVLRTRLKWLMFARLFIALCAMSTIVLIESRLRQPIPLSLLPAYYTLTFAIGINLIYLMLARLKVDLRHLAIVQVLVDLILESLLVYFTGIDRSFAYLYFATVLSAALLLSPRWAIISASVAASLLAATSLLYFFARHPDPLIQLQLPLVHSEVLLRYETRLEFMLPYLFFFALSLHVVAFLAGELIGEVSEVRIMSNEILRNIVGGVAAVDRFGQIVFVNDQATRLMAAGDPQQIQGRRYDEVLPSSVANLIARAQAQEDVVFQTVEIHERPIQVAISHLFDEPRKRLRGVLVVLNDMTLHVQMEALAERARRFRALLEMSAGMAHEVRNPLASIRGAAQELHQDPWASEDDRRLLGVIIRESDRLDKIMGDFLEYASDRPLEIEVMNLSQVIQETLLLLQARDIRKRVRLTADVPSSMVCRGSPDKIKAVLLNLGLNALDAVDEGGHVRLKGSRVDRWNGDSKAGVLVEVEDNGAGIPKESLPRVFDPFFTTKPQGNGMGLAIARKIIQAHGGGITIESQEGKGTNVKVWLPA